ncbi:unnamed protein product, partial [Mesorhabditis belari]|uniref:HIG1 domain-containing protein n=1 Tax=Mesorhabditis belari TaxID=2138241 RepID=A0AAF3FN07_9BILA
MVKDASAPHDFSDHTAHMQWRMEAGGRAAEKNVPMIPADLSGGSKSQSSSAAALQKFVSNPFIPLGLLATTGCLIGIMAQTLKRNPHKAQLYMRGRCAAQFFTVASIVGGAWFFGGFQSSLQPGQHGQPHQLTQK